MGPLRIWVPSRLGCALLKMIWVRRCSPSLQQRTQQAQQAQRDRQHRLAEDDLGQAVQALPAMCGHGRWAVESQLQQRTTKNQHPAQPLAATVPLYFPPTAHTARGPPPTAPQCPWAATHCPTLPLGRHPMPRPSKSLYLPCRRCPSSRGSGNAWRRRLHRQLQVGTCCGSALLCCCYVLD